MRLEVSEFDPERLWMRLDERFSDASHLLVVFDALDGSDQRDTCVFCAAETRRHGEGGLFVHLEVVRVLRERAEEHQRPSCFVVCIRHHASHGKSSGFGFADRAQHAKGVVSNDGATLFGDGGSRGFLVRRNGPTALCCGAHGDPCAPSGSFATQRAHRHVRRPATGRACTRAKPRGQVDPRALLSRFEGPQRDRPGSCEDRNVACRKVGPMRDRNMGMCSWKERKSGPIGAPHSPSEGSLLTTLRVPFM
mmetsp:Transcript_1903/g.11613  ORF Transcript_1903/g.11613 Transcript_1903/m.11613 type:complete len:250 (-) Transcript_1903:983-1732(-)